MCHATPLTLPYQHSKSLQSIILSIRTGMFAVHRGCRILLLARLPSPASGSGASVAKSRWPCVTNHHVRWRRTAGASARRPFTAVATKEATTSGGAGGGGRKSYFEFSRIKAFARFVRIVRIPAIIFGVYGLGYQQGIIDYSRDPDQKQDELLTTILAGVGCFSREGLRTSTEGSWENKNKATAVAASAAATVVKSRVGDDTDNSTGPSSDADGVNESGANGNTPTTYARERQFRRVGLVGERMTGVARKFVEEELRKVMSDRMKMLPEDIVNDENKLYRTLLKDDEFRLWAHARQRMDGRWKFHLVTSDIPNAFVSELLPQRIFVTTRMLEQFVQTDDEMALVLGHELSHLILGHVSNSNTLSTFLRTVEVLLLSLDPTEGVLSLGFMSLLAGSRAALLAANSRDAEAEADSLGIKLAAMGCYDTRAAAEVFDRMHKHDTESGEAKAEEAMASSGSILSFLDSHPPTEERYEYLIKASEEENAERYSTTTCGGMRTIFREMLKREKEEER